MVWICFVDLFAFGFGWYMFLDCVFGCCGFGFGAFGVVVLWTWWFAGFLGFVWVCYNIGFG